MPILREIEYVGLQDSLKIILFKVLEKENQIHEVSFNSEKII